MTAPVLVPNLRSLRDEFDRRWPRRDRASDGWIGDQAHAAGVSGHNPDESGRAERQDADRRDEVRALDVDRDLDTAAGDELYAELDRIRRDPDLRRRLIYIIYRRQIASASAGWVWRPYTGPNPHTEHGHLSGHPDYDDSTAPWGVASMEDEMLTDADVDRIATATARKTWTWDLLNGAGTDEAYRVLTRAATAAVAAAGRDPVDERAVAAELLTVLTPGAIAAALPDDVARQVADELAARLRE
ncbi:hypothetical protein ABT023_16210 [Micromonospora sp. NPDC002296]|uniref:hypothetical protein n=1 Tax=Micromonospora sp. NPDC002296 TaxID=3154271 RepID=UPI00332D4B50